MIDTVLFDMGGTLEDIFVDEESRVEASRQVLEITKEKVTLKNPEQCIACGLCEMRCPDYAIYLVNVEE